MKASKNIYKICFSAVCVALCVVLPFLTGQVQSLGNALCPMHIPVLICGFVCGWQYGMVIGFVAPLLRFFLFSMPPLFPIGVAMSFELAAYGLLCGVCYNRLPKKTSYIYLSLLIAMLGGRAVWGFVRLMLSGFNADAFTLKMFLGGAFAEALPGIVLQLVFVPALVLLLNKTKFVKNA